MKSLRYPIILLLLVIIFGSDGVRVCKTWADYLKPFSKKCFDNPDGEPSNVTQILKRWGCTVEEFQLLTEDGYYILVVQATLGFTSNRTPVLMGHGIYMNSLGFVLMFNKSIAYQLLKKGHEVFFINFRGTRYSTRHKTLTQKDEAYWKFSFHQMAEFDLPAVMDLVTKKTNGSKAIYMGYSMGTTVINIYCILYPEEATRRLRGIIELAPVANLTDIRSIAGIVSPLWPILKFNPGKMSFVSIESIERLSSELEALSKQKMWMQYAIEHCTKATDIDSAVARLSSELYALAEDAHHATIYDLSVCFDEEQIEFCLRDCENYKKGVDLCEKYSNGSLDLDQLCNSMIVCELRRFLYRLLPYLPGGIIQKYQLDDLSDDEIEDGQENIDDEEEIILDCLHVPKTN